MNKRLLHGFIVLVVVAASSHAVSAKPEGKQDDRSDKRADTSAEIKHHRGQSLEEKSMTDRHDTESQIREHGKDDKDFRHEKSKDVNAREERSRDRRGDDEDLVSGPAKQRDMKADQVQKELDRGSETGRQMRDEHSRKWWKFWE